MVDIDGSIFADAKESEKERLSNATRVIPSHTRSLSRTDPLKERVTGTVDKRLKKIHKVRARQDVTYMVHGTRHKASTTTVRKVAGSQCCTRRENGSKNMCS